MTLLESIARGWSQHAARIDARMERMLLDAREACEDIPTPTRRVAEWVEREFRDSADRTV